MKRLYFLFLFLLLLSSGCSSQPDTASEPLSVDNPFTPTESIPPPTTSTESPTYIRIENEVTTDELGPYLTYEGGEMRLCLRMRADELGEKDFGIHLYVDGQPQPYHTDANESSQYMHRFASQNGEEFTLDLLFIPVTGQANDILEIGFAVIAYPDYFIDEAWGGITMIDWNSMGMTVRMHYQADPPSVSLPELPDRLKQLSLEYTDLTSTEVEMFSSDTYLKEVEYEFRANQKKDFGSFFSVMPDDNLEFELELKGSSLADFGLVLYLDHQPVSVRKEELILVSTENGQKVTVRAQIDLSGFDGEDVFYAVLVPRNYRRDDLGGSCLLTILGPWYLSSAESLEAIP